MFAVDLAGRLTRLFGGLHQNRGRRKNGKGDQEIQDRRDLVHERVPEDFPEHGEVLEVQNAPTRRVLASVQRKVELNGETPTPTSSLFTILDESRALVGVVVEKLGPSQCHRYPETRRVHQAADEEADESGDLKVCLRPKHNC